MARYTLMRQLKDWLLVALLGGALSLVAVGTLGVLWALCSVVAGQ